MACTDLTDCSLCSTRLLQANATARTGAHVFGQMCGKIAVVADVTPSDITRPQVFVDVSPGQDVGLHGMPRQQDTYS